MGIETHGDIRAIADRYLHGVKECGPDNIMALCPFHDNHNSPAFTLSLAKGVWFCFSCHAKGTLAQFLRAMGEGNLTERYGPLLEAIAHVERAPTARDPAATPSKFLFRNDPLPDALLGLFDALPVELEEDGFREETLRYFEIGVDATHNRYTFPLRDVDGRLVGISGRSPRGGPAPKYRVYDWEFRDFALPERHGLNKRELIWNYHRVCSRVFSGEATSVIVVEGFKAAMWLHQCGYPDVIALLGSFLSAEQAWLLEHLGVPLYVFLDDDKAGRDGTKRLGNLLIKSLPIYVAEYPPAEYLDDVDDEHQPQPRTQPDNFTEAETIDILTHTVSFPIWSESQRK